jgi:hypothetical protein
VRGLQTETACTLARAAVASHPIEREGIVEILILTIAGFKKNTKTCKYLTKKEKTRTKFVFVYSKTKNDFFP